MIQTYQSIPGTRYIHRGIIYDKLLRFFVSYLNKIKKSNNFCQLVSTSETQRPFSHFMMIEMWYRVKPFTGHRLS